MTKQYLRMLPVWLLCASLAAPAHGHGNEPHPKKTGSPDQPVKKEQKPWGVAGDAAAVTRVIQVGMADTLRFSPGQIDVKQGETVKFVVANQGAVMHEFVIGTKKELDEHAVLMKKFPNMEHDEPYMAHVSPSAAGEVIWTFNRAGEFFYGCLLPGHYEAGMVGKIRVAAAERVAEDTEAEVRRVDRANGKVTLKHGYIKSIDMPPMTMVFSVKDPAQLDGLKVGDKVRFQLDPAQGRLVITHIKAAD